MSTKATGILWAINSPSLLITINNFIRLSLNSRVNRATGLTSISQPSAFINRNGL